MILSDMRDRLRARIGNPSVTDVTVADLNEHINSAYAEIADTFRFHNVRKLCRFTTVIGSKRYAIPEDCAVVLRARDLTNEKRLIKYDDRRAFEETAIATDGFPEYYSRFKNWVELHPSPNGAYEIELYYKAEVLPLVAEDDVPVLPKSWHEGILRLAKYYYYDSQGDIPKATAAHNIYNVWVQNKPVEVDQEKTDFDSGVSIPTLSEGVPKNLDFNHAD